LSPAETVAPRTATKWRYSWFSSSSKILFPSATSFPSYKGLPNYKLGFSHAVKTEEFPNSLA
ncbi:hypothetical protein L9F63_011095, partial [Diploptera punctata]